jgi:deoxyribonuclease V
MRLTSGKYGDQDIDLRALIYEAVAEIPEGRVATYGDIALALGDIKAARTVGAVLAGEGVPSHLPRHRVVYNDGLIGWSGGQTSGRDRTIESLRKEGVGFEGERIADMDAVRFSGFVVRPILKELAAHQERLRSRLVCEDDFGELRLVAGLDVSYGDDRAFGAVVVFDINSGKRISQRTVETEVCFPYVPGYLAFREMPLLRPLVDRHTDIIYLVDGHGVLHPRGFGIASMVGVELDAPTVGAAKSLLVGTVEGGTDRIRRVLIDGAVRGYRIGAGRSATYVSVGHRVSLATAVEVCDRFMRSSVPEPLREAHLLANSIRRQFQGGEAA